MVNKTQLQVLRKRGDFLNILKKGYRVHASSWLILNYLKNEQGELRCGWTLPRKVGPAVLRNRFKRWSRVYFRALLKDKTEVLSVDINLVFRATQESELKKLKYDQFAKVMDQGLAQVRKRIR